MVVARASGTDLASILKRNTFLTLEVRPVGRGPRGPRGTGGHGRPRDGGTRGAPGRGDTMGPGTGGRVIPCQVPVDRLFFRWISNGAPTPFMGLPPPM